jgi:hypothetical protein
MSNSQFLGGPTRTSFWSRCLHQSGCSRLALTLAITAASGTAAIVPAAAQDLSSFAVLAGAGITNTGSTTIDGNVGTWPTNTITGKDGPHRFHHPDRTRKRLLSGR